MKPIHWKQFLTALAASLLLALPQNIIGCGPTQDPWDYFTSFFSNRLDQPAYSRPFYYTALLKFYDDADYETNYNQDGGTQAPLVAEWKANTNPQLPDSSITQLVFGYSAADVAILGTHLAKNSPSTLPKKLATNAMAQHLVATKNTEAINYLLLAKTIEPFCNQADAWEAPKKTDSLAMNRHIATADARYKNATTPFFAAKYAFMRCKLAFYNNRHADGMQWYQEAFSKPELAQAAVAPLSLSYMAGSAFKTGNGKAAAYGFSKAFAASTHRKKEAFLGFYWATDGCNAKLQNNYLSACTNAAEKANMAAMFGLYGTASALPCIATALSLDSQCPLLPLLVVREINKLEEQYLTPKLRNQVGSKAYYTSWWSAKDLPEMAPRLTETLALFEQLMSKGSPKQKALYATAAAYVAFLQHQYPQAEALLATAAQSQPPTAVTHQIKLIKLLVAANTANQLDATAEAQLLPQLKWLKKQAEQDADYVVFYRNFFSEILAAQYARQNDQTKMLLCYAAADAIIRPDTITNRYFGYNQNAIDYLRSNMPTKQIEQLYTALTQPNPTPYFNFLIQGSPINTTTVIDMLGTTHLRDFNFAQAILWLKKAERQTPLTDAYYDAKKDNYAEANVNPFHDYLNDVQRYEKKLAKPFTKLSFAQKMLDLEAALAKITDAEAKSKLHYQLASGYYNISFYGNSYMAVDYYRHSSNWNSGNYTNAWEKEYYGVLTAGNHYKKAYELTGNKEFKAAAFFLHLKCKQRQVPRPVYGSKLSYDDYDSQLKTFQKQFQKNPLFASFTKEFGSTQFYKYTYNRCSYLRDFATKK
ncbi:MAG: hypothetical protein EAY75_09600 [Bacteroidetes bacterium]|nr:MAG: hypothetical protein EAY75_09600 [Bacteroidota bacterium]